MSITTNPKLWTTWANGSLVDHPNLYAEGYMLTDKAVDGEVNAFGSMKFSVPAEHPLYDTIKKIGTVVEAYDGDELAFRGRVMDTSREFDNTISVYCEGQLAFFCDTVMEPFAFKGEVKTLLTKIIENHNSQVDDSRKFEVGTITVTDPDDNGVLVRSSEKPLTSWEMIQNRLIDTLGGYIRVRKTKTGFAVDYLAEFVDVCDQVVKCGENLLDLEEYITADEVVTCLLPLGAKIEEDGTNENETDKYQELPEEAGATYMRNWYGSRVTVRSVNDGEAYVEDPDGVALWGKIYGTNTWDDVTEPANLLRKAKEYLSENVKSSITMTINAVDLHLVDVDIGRIHVGDLVKVYSSAHRLNRYMACIGTHKEPSDPAKNTITLGSTVKTLTQSLSGGSSLKTRIYALEGDSEYQGEQIEEHLKMLQAQAKEMKDLATHIENLQSDYAEITRLVAKKATIEQLNAVEAYITNLDAEKASIKELEAAVASIHELIADYATIDHLEANYATIDRLEAVVGSFETLLADYATIEHLESNYATIDKLNTDLANIKKLFADYARIDSLDAKYANIDFANIGMAAVEKLFSKSGIIKDLVVGDTSITGELVGVTIKGDLIEGNTVKADKLVVKGSDGLYYKLNVSGETVEAQQTDENSLNGSIITAKSITATKISVKDLVAFNATIGGYHITDKSLYSGAKASADNTTRGVYMDSDGQFSVGDESNYLRFFKGSDGKYKLELSASSVVMSTGQTVEDAISNVQGTIDKTRVVMLTSAAYTFNGTTAGAPVGSTCSTQVLAYNGATPCKVTVGTVTCPTGISATVTNNGTTSPTITFKTTTVVSAAGTASIPVTVDGVSITKQFAFAVAKTGVTGATGAKGDTGATGSPGRSISSVTPQYYLSTSKTTATGGSWSDTYPTTIAKGKWLWTRLKIVYKNPTATEYTAGAYESLSDSRIEQFRDSIRLVVTDPSGNETSIKIDDEDHITLTGTVLAQVIDVAKLFAGDITATGKIQFDNGKYSLSIDETAKAVELSSWAALRLDGSPVEITSTGGYVSVSATNAVEVDGHTIRIEGRHYKNSSFRTGRDNAALTISGPLEAGEYAPALSMPTANGTWDIGTYNDDTLWVNYITTADYEAGNNDRTARMAFRADNKLYLPGGLQLADGTIADYVVDKGFSNIWNYQKFASGRTTIWARVTVSSAACSTAMGNWYRTADVVGQVAWPFALAGIPSVNVAFGGDDAGALAWLRGQSTKEVFSGAYCVRPTSATLSGYVYIQVMGWWK